MSCRIQEIFFPSILPSVPPSILARRPCPGSLGLRALAWKPWLGGPSLEVCRIKGPGSPSPPWRPWSGGPGLGALAWGFWPGGSGLGALAWGLWPRGPGLGPLPKRVRNAGMSGQPFLEMASFNHHFYTFRVRNLWLVPDSSFNVHDYL